MLDTLKTINDTNRLQVLRGLNPNELDCATPQEWTRIFQEVAAVYNSKSSLREKREVMRHIYPHYHLTGAEQAQMMTDTHLVFHELMKRPDVLYSIYQWNNAPEERPRTMQTVALAMTQVIPQAREVMVSTFEEDSGILGFARPGENGVATLYINVLPKVLEKRSLSDVWGTLYHELTHKIQEDQKNERPHLAAPYFDAEPNETRRDLLIKQGYQFIPEQEYEAYSHHPKEIEAFLKGREMSKLLKAQLDLGLGKGLLEDPFMDDGYEQFCKNRPVVNLQGTTETTNPYLHLYAGMACAKKIVGSAIPQDSYVASDCLAHFQAVVRYGEFIDGINGSPAAHMLDLLSYYMTQPRFKKAVKNSGYNSLPDKLLEHCTQSSNRRLRTKAQLIAKRYKLNIQDAKKLIRRTTGDKGVDEFVKQEHKPNNNHPPVSSQGRTPGNCEK